MLARAPEFSKISYHLPAFGGIDRIKTVLLKCFFFNKMDIKWAPLNVSWNRRLEFLGALFFISIVLFGEAISVGIIAYFVVRLVFTMLII